MPIADRRSLRNTNRLPHWPSPTMRRSVSHATHGPPQSGQVCRTALTTVERIIDFSIFGRGDLPLGQRSPKGEMTYYPLRSTTLQGFSPIAQTVYKICATKVFHFLVSIFDFSRSSKVKSDGTSRKPMGPTYKCFRAPTLYLSPFSRYFEPKFWLLTFWPWSG